MQHNFERAIATFSDYFEPLKGFARRFHGVLFPRGTGEWADQCRIAQDVDHAAVLEVFNEALAELEARDRLRHLVIAENATGGKKGNKVDGASARTLRDRTRKP